MFNLDKDKAKTILVTELGYKLEDADFYLDHYPTLHDDLAEAARVWLQDRRVLDVAVDGITIREVMKNHDSHFLDAVRILNDLLTRPLSAEEKEALKTALRHPLIRA